ncbi:hypothetical protein D3C81_2185330 [compost metagenome]
MRDIAVIPVRHEYQIGLARCQVIPYALPVNIIQPRITFFIRRQAQEAQAFRR